MVTERAASGTHPLLTVTRREVALHPDAAPIDDTTATGLRCGGCVFREASRHNDRTRSRCVHGIGDERRSHRQIIVSWPACVHYQPKPEPTFTSHRRVCKCDDPTEPKTRGKCRSCYSYLARAGQLPVNRQRTRAETVDEYEVLKELGLPPAEIVAALGVRATSLRTALEQSGYSQEELDRLPKCGRGPARLPLPTQEELRRWYQEGCKIA
jgi:hypothetical protein